ncbi:hypothetical protein N9C75_00485 [Alphaproteobacteria bacterium]|jgi:hypothetical protein|nr:hypothetical protein [Alphaproteobacteria bacterium]MBT5798511.1 hypothetical protein [Alphaproteobacteria bacterium]MDA9815511.1 hypothetical protein [Alphaproteobacteria bacterium]
MFDVFELRTIKLRDALLSLSQLDQKILSIPYFTYDEITALNDYTNLISFRFPQYKSRTKVVQDFKICFPAPKIGALKNLVDHFNHIFSCTEYTQFFSAPIFFNDFAVQRYDIQSNGIGVHKDAIRYRDLIIIICLAGESDLYISSERDGAQKTFINDHPGRLVLMAGPGFKNLGTPDKRVLHGVTNITSGRLSIGLRCDIHKD